MDFINHNTMNGLNQDFKNPLLKILVTTKYYSILFQKGNLHISYVNVLAISPQKVIENSS